MLASGHVEGQKTKRYFTRKETAGIWQPTARFCKRVLKDEKCVSTVFLWEELKRLQTLLPVLGILTGGSLERNRFVRTESCSKIHAN